MKHHAALLNPRYPERICWGCDKFCPADELACGNGTIRTPHPAELFGADWLTWEATNSSADALLASDSCIEGDNVSQQERVESEEHG